MNISRRDFIKGSLPGAAVAALSAVPTTAFADRTGILSEDKTFEEGQYSFEIPPEKVPESEINETIDVDICIVGAGQAGTLAALTAGKLGAKAVVLQKASTVWCHGRVANMIHFDPTVLPEGNAPLSDFPFLAVNLLGERFMNEEIVYQYKINAALSQPEHTYYQIGGKDMPAFVKSQNDIRKYTWDDAFERGAIQEGQTIEELAEKIGVPADKLRKTIERYDELVKNGEDVDFGKSPEKFANTAIVEGPYYSIKRRAGILTCPGGLVTNDRLQVLDNDNNVIEGLYVAGNTVGRFYGYDYPIHGFKTIESGHSSGRAMTFGRLAAKFAMEDGE